MIGAVVVLILLGVGGYLVLGNKKAPSAVNAPANQEQNTGIVGSIKDAIMGGQSITCDYTDATGKKIVAFTKNGQVRTDITSSNPDEAGSVIIKDKKMYYWTAKGGFVMEIPDTTVTPGTTDPNAMNQDEVMENLENYKQYCKPGTVDDSMFVVPANIKFQDMSKTMQQAMPSGVDRAQVEDLMKKYTTPTQ